MTGCINKGLSTSDVVYAHFERKVGQRLEAEYKDMHS